MSTPLKIALFTLLVTGFYTYVGAIVPQMESHPPQSTEIAADLSSAELGEAGRDIFFAKGTCALCHTIGEAGQRCPDLEGIGARAGDRVAELSATEYLAQSLYQPNVYLVDGYTPTMPRIDRAPIGLTSGEIAAVVAFLQSLGGEITVTPSTTFAFADSAPPPPAARPEGVLDAQGVIDTYGCKACHMFDGPIRLLAPSLYDIGAREGRAQILQSIVEPDAVIAEADPPYLRGLMLATLGANGFYESVTLAELEALVDYLATLQGGSL